MKRAMLEELLVSATEALEHAQGKRELRTTVLPPSLRPSAHRRSANCGGD